MFFAATDRPIRKLPAGCDGQGRFETRTHRAVILDDSETGSADAIGDDRAGAAPRQNAAALSAGAMSMRRHRRARNSVALALCLGVVALITRACWPLAGG